MKKQPAVIKRLLGDDVQIVTLVFSDLLGRWKGLNIGGEEVERAFGEGIVFDGSSVEGFVRIEESDLIAMPDPQAVFVMPEKVSGLKTAYVVCDILRENGAPFERDPRWVFKRLLNKLRKDGYTYLVGPELEYFYSASREKPVPLDSAGYFDSLPSDPPTLAREEAVRVLREMGIRVEACHHEVASSQHEIDLRYDEALRIADCIQITKMVVKEIASKYKLYASFMPKPLFGINGSGMHIHMSLWKNGANAFYNAKDSYQLAKEARHFLAGLLKYAQHIVMVTNQWVNSYKRLVAGYEAPVYVSWGRFNRSTLVRVPSFKRPASARVEFRVPDPGMNPYLGLAAILSAGLRGMADRLAPPEPLEADIYHMAVAEREKQGIATLPASLSCAIDAARESPILREALGDSLFEKLVANKLVEWDKFRIAVTDYEIATYYEML